MDQCKGWAPAIASDSFGLRLTRILNSVCIIYIYCIEFIVICIVIYCYILLFIVVLKKIDTEIITHFLAGFTMGLSKDGVSPIKSSRTTAIDYNVRY